MQKQESYCLNIEIPADVFECLRTTDLHKLPEENHRDVLIMLGEIVRYTVQDLDY